MGLEKIIVRLNPDVPPTGSDLGVVNAARRSFNRRSDWAEDGRLRIEDRRLLEFLARGMSAKDYEAFIQTNSYAAPPDLIRALWQWRNTPTHDTPINHGFFSFEVACPIFVRAQLVKHEYLVLSEFSRRYITDDVEFYDHEYRLAAANKKQGSGALHPRAVEWQAKTHAENLAALARYNEMLEDGVAPEQARGHLPQDLMTAFTWSGTFGAFAKMCQLRLGAEAQEETRHVARQVYSHLEQQFPVSAPLFVFGG
jgi:thymidylate synthase (FAD)